MYALAGAWGGAVIVLLYCIAIGSSNASLFANHVPKHVAIFAAIGAAVGLVLGWLVTPEKPPPRDF